MKSPAHVLITGASSGLGAVLASRYAAPGIRLSLHGRDCQRLEQIAIQARASGAEAAIHPGDVTDATDMANWVKACDRQQPLDLVIANAGISAGISGGPESAEQAARIFATNIGGVLNTAHPALAAMRPRRRGQIAIVSSLAGFRGMPGAPAYGASKAAVRVYGEALRADLAKDGIAVNVICPGFIRTPMTDVNTFNMPLLMTAERAARLIQAGLAANQGRIAFPWQFYVLVRLITALPQPVGNWIAQQTPKK